MEENNQPLEESVTPEQNDGITFLDEEEGKEALARETSESVEQQELPAQPTPQESQEPEQLLQDNVDQPVASQPEGETQYSPQDVEGAVLEFLSERLGRDIASLDDLTAQQQEQRELDERISAIASFVEETGRDPQDWFIYQQLNPSEMDDMTAIQVQMASDYPNLSQEEVSLLLSSKYKIDPDLHSEDEVKLSQLQMKIDAENARKGIDEMRLRYQTPERQAQEETSLIDDGWVSNMQSELDALDGIDFDLGNGNTFTFGMDETYKGQLAEKNARLDEFFDPYVREDGSWDYDMLNMHRAVIDNVDRIVQSVYRQGMADGQRGIVQNAANASPTSPNQGNAQPAGDPLAQQLREALGLR